MILILVSYLVIAAIAAKAPEYPVRGVLFLLVPTVLGILALARAPAVTRSSSWIEVDGPRIRFVPSFYAQKLTAETTTEAALLPQSQIIVSRNTALGMFEGFSVAVRSTDSGGEQVIWRGGRDFEPLRWTQFSTEFSAATGIPVRLVARELTEEGVRESDWMPARNPRSLAALLAVGALPYVGGSLVGWFAPHALIIVLAGLILWALQVAIVYVYRRAGVHAANESNYGLYVLTTLFTFSAQYALAIVVCLYLLRAH